jgi:serine/threonine-protein kinase
VNASDIIEERYRLERLLGTGGMSEVWLAEDLRLGRWVALKILRDGGAAGELASDLEREARLVARLQHPNIVSVFDTGRHDGRPFVVMEYVHGLSLRDLMQHRGRMSESEALRYALQIAGALQYAHEQGVVHCDIKPENILVTEQGVAKAADFGVADTVTRTLSPEEARGILGTIAYIAPEVLQGDRPDPRSDVYSLALTVYEMVAGRLPFTGASPAALAGQRLAMAAPPVRTFAPDVSAGLEGVLARALTIIPDDRYQGAGEFASALRSIGRQVPAAAAGGPPPPVRSPRPAPAPARRHPTERLATAGGRRPPPPRQTAGPGAAVLWAIVGAIGLAAIGGAVAALVLTGNDSSPPAPTPTPTATIPAATPTQPQLPTRDPPRTATPTPTAEPTPTPTPTATATEQPTRTPTSTRTPSPTPQTPVTVTPTPPETVTPAPSPTEQGRRFPRRPNAALERALSQRE